LSVKAFNKAIKNPKTDVDWICKNEEVIQLLKTYEQEHIVQLLEKLEGEKKEKLVDQINKIDFHQMMELYENTKKEIEIKENKIEAIKYLDKEKLTKNEKEKFEELGQKIIVSNQYAVVTMAGGQGTRLGHTGPKGTFKLDVYGKGKYLFEILAENLKEANKKYDTTIPWYIMTSKENNDETQEFLEKHNYFGYDKNNVMMYTEYYETEQEATERFARKLKGMGIDDELERIGAKRGDEVQILDYVFEFKE